MLLFTAPRFKYFSAAIQLNFSNRNRQIIPENVFFPMIVAAIIRRLSDLDQPGARQSHDFCRRRKLH
jgi:hypothetical protein